MLEWQIAYKDLKLILKDFKSLFILILLPIILIFILGISLHSFFDKNDGNITKADIVLIDQDHSAQSKQLVDFFSEESIQKYVTVLDLKEDQAEKMLKEGDLTAIIRIPRKFEENLMKGTENPIDLSSNGGKPTQSSIVWNILKRYLDSVTMVLATQDAIQKSSDAPIDAGFIMQETAALFSDQEDLIKYTGFSNSEDTLSAMQYYSAAMVSMFILFVGMVGTSSFLEEKENGTFTRMLMTKASRSKIISGKVLGTFLIGLIDTAVFILFTKFVYHVDWGNSLTGLILITVTMVFAASGLSIFIATLFQRSKDVDLVNSVVIFIMALAGGNMLSVYDMSDTLRKLSGLLMNHWSLQGYLNLMINNGLSSIYVPSLVLILMGSLFMAAGIIRIGGKK